MIGESWQQLPWRAACFSATSGHTAVCVDLGSPLQRVDSPAKRPSNETLVIGNWPPGDTTTTSQAHPVRLLAVIGPPAGQLTKGALVNFPALRRRPMSRSNSQQRLDQARGNPGTGLSALPQIDHPVTRKAKPCPSSSRAAFPSCQPSGSSNRAWTLLSPRMGE